MDPQNEKTAAGISITDLVAGAPAELAVRIVSGNAPPADKRITSDRIQKLGLALAGFPNYIHPGRLQILGQSEVSYLAQLEPGKRTAAWKHLDNEDIASVLLTNGISPPAELLEFSARHGVAVLQTPAVSSKAIGLLTVYLQRVLAPQSTIHGVMLCMYGTGVLLLGDSGIGKSECALDLISRGHSLVADDAVTIKKRGSALEGESPELTREYLEIRGIGIVNVRELFGVPAVTERSTIDLCIELVKWSEIDDVERLGLEMNYREILGVEIPEFVLPVTSGRHLSTLVETATKIFLLRKEGREPVRNLVEAHSARVGAKRT